LVEECQQKVVELSNMCEAFEPPSSQQVQGSKPPVFAATAGATSHPPHAAHSRAGQLARSGRTAAGSRSHARCKEETGSAVRDTLRKQLMELSTEDPRSIFITRRINKLGFRSREILHQHYNQYGEVSRVLVAHSEVKPFRDSNGQLRTRPGGLGLIVMRDPASVTPILALGEEQMVAGHMIRVQRFDKPKVTCEMKAQADDTGYTGNGSGTSTALGSGSRGSRSDWSGSRSPDKSEEGGSSEPYEKSDVDVGSSGSST